VLTARSCRCEYGAACPLIGGGGNGLQVLVTPALTLGFAAGPLAAWLLVRSERRHTVGRSSATGRRTVIGVLAIVLGGIALSRVVLGLLLVLEIGLALFAGMLLAAVWELWRGTYRAGNRKHSVSDSR
jgi:hypothetical protein